MKRIPIIKVFAATMARDRDTLGETATAWMRDLPTFQLTEIRTHQSSDSSFHCVTIIVIGTVEVRS